MIVEDEGVVALQIRDTLQTLGYDVPLAALSGEEAIAHVLDTEPDLVLMDIHLEGRLSGIEAARRIRGRLDVPIVYLTAFSDTETLAQAQLTEPYGYVLKPFEEKSLHAIIQMSLMKHARTRAAREKDWWMSAVAASMREAVVISDPKGYIKFVNPSMEALLASDRSTVLDRRLTEVFALADEETGAEIAFPVTEPLVEGKSTLRASCRLRAAAGKDVVVELSASPLRSPEGTLFGVLYVLRETAEQERVRARVVRELEEVARLERKTLPARGTVIAGMRCEWLLLPTPQGGGDALGFFALPDGHAAFYAVDVAGRGVLSCLSSLLLHAFLSPCSERGGLLVAEGRIRPASEVVKELNQRFYTAQDARPCFTLVYGVVEEATGTVRLARAGHPCPMLQKAGGEVRILQPEGYAVGLFAGAEPSTDEIRLEKGDRLFLYSDGLVDAVNSAGEKLTCRRLAEIVSQEQGKSLAGLAQSVQEKLTAWRGPERESSAANVGDDVSFLALEKE
jgi:PAS domain S-box-containing protein